MEILFSIGGGVLALFHYLFSVAVVVFVADLSGGGSSAVYLWRRKNGRKANKLDKIETLQDRF